MQLIYKDEKNELKRDTSALTTIFEKVSELIEQKDTIFSHLLVDDAEVYEDHEAYINKRINEIMKIEIVTRSTNEMIWETMESVNEYLQRAVPALKELVDNSYDNFTEKTWEGISQLTEGLQWVLQFKTFTQSAPEQPANWEEFEEKFGACEEHLTPLLEAIEAQDTVLISDILAYEITPAFEGLTDSTAKMLQDKSFLNKVN